MNTDYTNYYLSLMKSFSIYIDINNVKELSTLLQVKKNKYLEKCNKITKYIENANMIIDDYDKLTCKLANARKWRENPLRDIKKDKKNYNITQKIVEFLVSNEEYYNKLKKNIPIYQEYLKFFTDKLNIPMNTLITNFRNKARNIVEECKKICKKISTIAGKEEILKTIQYESLQVRYQNMIKLHKSIDANPQMKHLNYNILDDFHKNEVIETINDAQYKIEFYINCLYH